MGKYKESYINLYHGTTVDAANEIIATQQFIPSNSDNWCGSGVYFYDVKAKARWAADRKCEEIYRSTGKKIKGTYVNADIIDLDRDFILDLRAYQDFKFFAESTECLLEQVRLSIADDIPEEEKIIILRGILISYFAQEYNKKLVIGHFRQRTQPKFISLFDRADDFNLVIGVETIYCVKDSSIISNIRGA